MKNILMLFMALLMSLPIVAQQRRVSGVVVDQKDGSAIIGANVLEKGTRNGAVADVNGNFSLNVTSSNPTLVITSIGYKTLEMSIGNQTSLRISMEDKTAELEEVVVVGYGTMKKATSRVHRFLLAKKRSKDQSSPTSTRYFKDALPG